MPKGRATAGSWKKGQSGNPKGRKVGTRCRATLAAEAILQKELNKICNVTVREAIAGQPWAAKVVLDKFMPQARSRPVMFDMDAIKGPEDIPAVLVSVAREVARGEITTLEAAEIGGLLDVLRQSYETAQLVADVERLKAQVATLIAT